MVAVEELKMIEKSLEKAGMKLTPSLLIYISVVLMRAANASFIISLTTAFPDISAWMQGIIQASYSFTEALFGIFSGIIYEYLGSSISIIFSSSLLFISYAIMTVFADMSISAEAFTIPSALAGLSASFLLTSSLAVISEETIKASTKGRLFGVGGLEVSNIIGYAVGFTFAGTLQLILPSAIKGFSPSFLFSFLAFLSSIILSKSMGRRNISEFKNKKITFHLKAKIEGKVLKLVPMWFGFSIVMGVAFISPKFLSELFSPIEVSNPGLKLFSSFMLLFALIILSLGVMGGSYIASILGKVNSLLAGSLSLPSTLVMLSILVSYGSNIKGISMFFFTLILLIFSVLALSIPPTLLSLLADFTDLSRIRGPSSGVYVTSMGIGIALGESLGGKIYDVFGLETLLLILAIVFLPLGLSTWIMLYFERSRKNISSKPIPQI
ncbi:hypothetical protein FFONT_0528 [Fervidicoccus fontis Kam940]|uniref:Major facilitator superfamily (MFS) profile domain-containing protein n=2 Tax=Fervidicoccus fontis TaxID=683846 RepID=I0A0L1_FERFK|nr:hypothetical protein FFONT_0528 [Fervidicoccus fontis Kam940]